MRLQRLNRVALFVFDFHRSSLKLQKKAVKELRAMFDTTAYFDSEQITGILMVWQILILIKISVLLCEMFVYCLELS